MTHRHTPRKSWKKLLFPFLLLGLSLFLIACNGEHLTVERQEDGSALLTFDISEADLNAAIADELAARDGQMQSIVFDLADGNMTLEASWEAPQDGRLRSANFDVTPSVSDGVVAFTVTAATLDGEPAEAERLERLNGRLLEGALQRATREERIATVESVSVANDRLTISGFAEELPESLEQ